MDGKAKREPALKPCEELRSQGNDHNHLRPLIHCRCGIKVPRHPTLTGFNEDLGVISVTVGQLNTVPGFEVFQYRTKRALEYGLNSPTALFSLFSFPFSPFEFTFVRLEWFHLLL